MIFQVKIQTNDKPILLAIEALSYKEAETKGEDIIPIVANEFAQIETVVKTQFKEYVEQDDIQKDKDSKYFKGKIAYTVQQDNGKMKTTKIPVLLHAQDFGHAHYVLSRHAESFMEQAIVFGLEETEISDYYDHEKYMCLEVVKINDSLKSEGMNISVNEVGLKEVF